MTDAPSSRRSFLRRLLPLLILARPLNVLIAGLSVYVGALTGSGSLASLPVLLAALSAALVTGAGNAFNDAIDLDIDRINRPGRPLPAGMLQRRTALLEGLLLALGGWGLASRVSGLHGLLAGTIIGLLILYSKYLKTTPLWGNLAVALIGAAVFPYGALASGPAGRSWIPAGFALLFHLGREIVKDLEDMEGDQSRGARTLPLHWGAPRAMQFAAILYLALIAFTLFPWLAGLYGTAYLGTVLLVDLLVLFVLHRLRASRGQLHDSILGQVLKIGMLVGLLAIVVGETTR